MPQAKYKGATIAIVGNGPSIAPIILASSGLKRAHVTSMEGYSNPIWAVNGGWHYHPTAELGFVMDDLEGPHLTGGASAIDNIENVEWYKELIKSAKIPIYSSVAYYPSQVRYPIEEIVRRFGTTYFCESIHYMIALAIYWGVKVIDLFGVDYCDGIREHERSGTEFWCGVALANGVIVRNMSPISKLLRFEPIGPEWSDRMYGYLKAKDPFLTH